MHQHIKNAPGKLMNILLKPFPKILIQRKKDVKPSEQRVSASVWAPSRAHPCPFPSMRFLFPLKLSGYPGGLQPGEQWAAAAQPRLTL